MRAEIATVSVNTTTTTTTTTPPTTTTSTTTTMANDFTTVNRRLGIVKAIYF